MGFAYLCGLPTQVAIVLRDLNIESMSDFSTPTNGGLTVRKADADLRGNVRTGSRNVVSKLDIPWY